MPPVLDADQHDCRSGVQTRALRRHALTKAMSGLHLTTRRIGGLAPTATAARTVPSKVSVRVMAFFNGSTFGSGALMQDRLWPRPENAPTGDGDSIWLSDCS
jgi:hypothetical protein